MAIFRVRRHGPVRQLEMSRTLLGRPMYFVSAYLIDGVVIDTGLRALRRPFMRCLREAGAAVALNTHAHEDHVGNNQAIARELGVRPRAHPQAVSLLARPIEMQLYRRLVWGWPPEGTQVDPLGEWVEHEALRLRVIETPGHCPDHVVFLDEQRGLLFLGDLFVHERVRYMRVGEDVGEIIRSLERVLTFGFEQAFCAHRGALRDGPVAVRRKLEHLRELVAHAADLHDRGLPLAEVSRRLHGPEGLLRYASLGHFSKQNYTRGLLEASGRQVG